MRILKGVSGSLFLLMKIIKFDNDKDEDEDGND